MNMSSVSKKLKDCEVCGGDEAKYTCPKCEVRTCSLTCVNIHKKELACDGIRDRTKFIPLKSFTDLDLLSDYRLLEDVGRSVDQLKRNPMKKCTNPTDMPIRLHKLKSAASHRRVDLQYLPQHFSKHKNNTTYLNWKTNELFWRVELLFPQAENSKWVIERALESSRLSDILEQVLDPVASLERKSDIEELNLKLQLKDKLQYYQAAGLTGIKVLLKAEKILKANSRFHELDLNLTLRENFENKTIIEFPALYVVMKDHSDMYEMIDTDDEVTSFGAVTSQENIPRKRKWPRRGKHAAKKEDMPINYFFNNDFSESEDDTCLSNQGTINILAKSRIHTPTYTELV